MEKKKIDYTDSSYLVKDIVSVTSQIYKGNRYVDISGSFAKDLKENKKVVYISQEQILIKRVTILFIDKFKFNINIKDIQRVDYVKRKVEEYISSLSMNSFITTNYLKKIVNMYDGQVRDLLIEEVI